MNKFTVASILRRASWLMHIAQPAVKFFQARFTAGVVGVVFNARGEVLLLKHVYHPKHPWGLPGGWLNRREDPEDGVRREILEEAGLPVAVERPLIVQQGTRRGHLDIAYLCRARGEVGTLSSEILDYAWYAPAELPPLSEFHTHLVAFALEVQRVTVGTG
jgi:ADP-ribose pyrophosphatase YjhB (NUDIX family)